MRKQVDLIATRSFSYRTRRMMPGDSFQADESDARLLIAIKKASLTRVPGKVPAPPAALVERARTLTVHPTPMPDESFSGFLDRPVSQIAKDIPALTVEQLRAYRRDEGQGKSRKGLVAALDAEIAVRSA